METQTLTPDSTLWLTHRPWDPSGKDNHPRCTCSFSAATSSTHLCLMRRALSLLAMRRLIFLQVACDQSAAGLQRGCTERAAEAYSSQCQLQCKHAVAHLRASVVRCGASGSPV